MLLKTFLGKKLGFSFSREDLLIWVQENEKKCRARAEKAEASMEKALDPEEMSKVAGEKEISAVKVHLIIVSGAGSRIPARLQSIFMNLKSVTDSFDESYQNTFLGNP